MRKRRRKSTCASHINLLLKNASKRGPTLHMTLHLGRFWSAKKAVMVRSCSKARQLQLLHDSFVPGHASRIDMIFAHRNKLGIQ